MNLSLITNLEFLSIIEGEKEIQWHRTVNVVTETTYICSFHFHFSTALYLAPYRACMMRNLISSAFPSSPHPSLRPSLPFFLLFFLPSFLLLSWFLRFHIIRYVIIVETT